MPVYLVFFAGSQKTFAVSPYIVKIECPVICSNPIARKFSRLSAAE
jgi:hypothetical protein